MKLSNFKMIEEKYEGIGEYASYLAEIDVETKFFWKKKKERRLIGRVGSRWIFKDTGKYCPTLQLERLLKKHFLEEKFKLNVDNERTN